MTMVMTAHEMIADSCSRFISVREFDSAALNTAKDIFEDYKKRGVIINGNFEDSAWTLTNETQNIGLTLLTFEGGAKKKAMSWIGCTYHQYMTCVKTYIMFNLGQLGLCMLREMTIAFNKLTAATNIDAVDMEHGSHIVALLQFIPGGSEQRDAVIEELEEKMEHKKHCREKGNQRQLADFTSYLRFHKILAEFWSNANKRQKLFYFPLYFWWNLTAILPLRPTEFLLTPRNCLHTRDREQTLTIRRTKLKGGQEKISYRVADDYKPYEYTINEHLTNEIRWYISATEKMRKAKLDTLLLQKPHFDYIGRKGHISNRYYTYGLLNTCRKYFYQEVVAAQKESVAEINFGDTRHLAMANLILSGGSPVICRELAGHAHIDTSSHYYTNISEIVMCATLERCRKAKGREGLIHGRSKYPIVPPQNYRAVNDGRCVSVLFRDGRIDDCLNAISNDGHMGECRCCTHFLPDNPGIMFDFYDTDAAKAQVDADSLYLISMIEVVRKGLGYAEDIGAALLRLQQSGDHYSKCLQERYSRGEEM